MGLRVLGLGLGFWDLAEGLWLRVLGSGLGFGVYGFGIWLRVWCLGFWDLA